MILKTESITYCQIFTITGSKIFIKQDRTKMKKKITGSKIFIKPKNLAYQFLLKKDGQKTNRQTKRKKKR